MPMDCQFANVMPLEPLLCHFNHWDATPGESHFMGPSLYSTASAQGLAPRLFPSIEGNDRGATVPLQSHCVTEDPLEPSHPK